MLAGVPSTITLHFALRVNRGEEIVRYSFGDLDPIQSNVGACLYCFTVNLYCKTIIVSRRGYPCRAYTTYKT